MAKLVRVNFTIKYKGDEYDMTALVWPGHPGSYEDPPEGPEVQSLEFDTAMSKEAEDILFDIPKFMDLANQAALDAFQNINPYEESCLGKLESLTK